MEGIKNQQGAFQLLGSNVSKFGVIEQANQRGHVITTQHRAKNFGGLLARNQRAGRIAFGHIGKERRFHISGLIDTRRHAFGEHVHQGFFFAFGG